MRRPHGLVLTLVLLVAACGGPAASASPQSVPSPGCHPPSAAPSPTDGGCGGGAPLDEAGLRLLLIDDLGPRWYCDPDEYPISQGTEQERAIARYAEMVAEHELFTAVARRLGIDAAASHTDAQKLELYRLWKVALSIPLDPVGDDRWRFDYLAQPQGGAAEGTRTTGIVDARGTITVEQQAAAGEPMCPICLARWTTIDTPSGAVAVDRLRLGDTVWTLDGRGRRVPGTVIAIGSTDAPVDHRVVNLGLADGRSLTASPGHPLADGRTLGELAIGAAVDGSAVSSWELVAYGSGATFDLVVSGETGLYLAGGIALGSTLR